MGVTSTYYLHRPQFEKSQSVALNTHEVPSQGKDETSKAERIPNTKLTATKQYSNVNAKSIGILPKGESKEIDIIEKVEAKTPESHFELDTHPPLEETQQPQLTQPVSTEPDPGAVLL